MKSPIEILMEKVHSGRHLFYASLELTYACNFACRFCYNPVERAGQPGRSSAPALTGAPLEIGEINTLLKKLREAGVLYFTMTGGEPMVHPYFWQILESAREQAFAVRIFTNGSLIDGDAAKRFGRIFPNCIELSLYGASEESYEKTCGRGAAFQKVIRAIKLLKDEGLTIYLKCMLTKITEKEMERIQDIAEKFKCQLSWDPVLKQSDDGLDYPLRMAPSRDSVVKLFSTPRFKTGRSPFERGDGAEVCNIGKNLIHIDPFGNIYPCLEWNEPIGNIRNDDIRHLWEDHPKLRELMCLAKEMACKVEKLPVSCHYCMGSSMKKYNDPKKIDDDELQVAQIRRDCLKPGKT
jgi:radical SAM protein with 4Fe4S-binding SPASM domain